MTASCGDRSAGLGSGLVSFISASPARGSAHRREQVYGREQVHGMSEWRGEGLDGWDFLGVPFTLSL